MRISTVSMLLICLVDATGAAEGTSPPEIVLQTGHVYGVASLEFSPDGKAIASASADGTIILWDAGTGRQVRTFKGDNGFYRSMCFSPDGQHLAAIGFNNLYSWEVSSGREVRRIDFERIFSKRNLTGLWTSSVTGGGKRALMVLGSPARAAIVWDVDAGDILLNVDEGGLTVSADGKCLVSCSDARAVSVWNVDTGKRVQTFDGQLHADQAALDSSGKRLAVWDWKGRSVELRDVATGKRIATVGEHTKDLWSVTWSPNGERILTQAYDRTAVLWDAQTGKKLATFATPRYVPFAATFSPDGRRVGIAAGGEVQLWDAESGKAIRTLAGAGLAAIDVTFAPVGSRFATRSLDQLTRVWDGETGGRASGFPAGPKAVVSMSFSEDGNELLSATTDGTIFRSRQREAEPVALLRTGKPAGVAHWTTDRKRVLLLSRTAELWDIESGKKIQEFDSKPLSRAGDPTIEFATVSGDGSRVLSFNRWADGRGAMVWDAATGKIVANLRPQDDAGITSAAISPDGTRVVTALGIGEILIWTSGGRIERRIAATDRNWDLSGVLYTAFTHDGKKFFTASRDFVVRLWDVETGTRLIDFRGHTDRVTSVTQSADGRRLLTASSDCSVRMWDSATGRELARLLPLSEERDWLACTPDGLFDGSAGGRNIVSFRVGGGLNVVPVDRFFKDFYRPGLLAAVLKGEKPKPEVDFAAQTPPKLRITSPKTGGDVDGAVVEVIVEAEDQGGGVQTPWLKHNGVRVAGTTPAERAGKVVRRTFTVALIQGMNALEAQSACTDGSWESEPAKIELRYARAVEKPRLFVLTVGVNKYPDAALELKFAAPDAKSVHDLFARRGKQLYASVEGTLLTDDKATREGIRAAFKAIAAKARPQDTLAVFLAGHGTLVGQRYYYLPADYQIKAGQTQEQAIRAVGLPDDELADLMGSTAALKRMLLLDTCNAGGAAALFALRGRSADSLRGVTERLNRAQGVFVLAAAAANEEAKEPAELGHGVLTYAVLAGMRAADDGPLKDDRGVEPGGREPVADVLGLFTYAAGQVPRLMKKYYGKEQDVQTSSAGTSFPLLPLRD